MIERRSAANFNLSTTFKMFLLILLSCVALSSEVLAADKIAVGNTEFDGGVVEVVRAILQDEGFGSLYKTVVELQKKVLLQEKRIQFLEARDGRRQKVVAELLMTVGNLKKTFEAEQEDRNSASGNDGKIEVTEEKFVSRKQGTQDILDTGIKRRQISVPENVGFTAYLDHNIDHMAPGHTIKPNQVLLNDGDGYNNTTGIFTVPVSGVYLFNFHYNSHFRKTLVGLFVDGKNEVDAISVPKDASQEMMGGNTAVLRVNFGQSVWLEDIVSTDGEIYTTPVARYATFSGVLLYM